MSDTTLNLDLDPKKVLESLQVMAKQSQELADQIEKSLNKDAGKSIRNLEDNAEQGSNKLSSIFRNLGNRIKEDLKNAFALASVAEGLNMAKQFKEGALAVFDMDKAFDKLNTRLGLSSQKLLDFKKGLASSVAGTGQKLQDVMPGVENVAARGGVTDPGQLSAIGEMLGQAKAVTGEDVGGLADAITQIITDRGDKVTAANFKQTMDSLQGARVGGSFQSAGMAADFVKEIGPSLRAMGMSTREGAGLAAVGSKAGDRGLSVLEQVLQKGQTQVGRDQMNAIMGREIFDKSGKFNQNEFGKVDTKQFGMMSESVMGEALGISGASGQDLTRLVAEFKKSDAAFKKVVEGTNETADQFETATDNFSTKFDKFKEKLKAVTLAVGSDLSQAANDFLKGDFKKGMGHVAGAAADVYENKGTVAAGLASVVGAGLLAGGGLSALMSKLPGGGALKGVVGKVAGAAGAEAMGAQPVYVVNMPDGGMMGAAGAASGMGGKLGSFAGKAGMVGMALAGGMAVGEMINQNPTASKAMDDMMDKFTGVTEDTKSAVQMAEAKAMRQGYDRSKESGGMASGMTFDEYVRAVEQGTTKARQATQDKVQYTNPSAVKGTGPKAR